MFHKRRTLRQMARKVYNLKGSLRDQYWKLRILFPDQIENLSRDYLWESCDCPYYNVYPAIIPLLLKINISKVNSTFLHLPFPSLQLRFKGDWFGIKTIQINRVKFEKYSANGLGIYICNGETIDVGKDYETIGCFYMHMLLEGTVEEEIEKCKESTVNTHDKKQRVFSLEELKEIMKLISTLLLIQDDELIDYDFLSKDVGREVSIDSKIKRMKSNNHFGFNVGKNYEQGPYIVPPHPQCYWTGKGRTIPTIKVRSGYVARKNILKGIPSGYDRENEE